MNKSNGKLFGHDNDRQSNFLEFSRNPGTKTCMFLRRIPMQKKISDQTVAHFYSIWKAIGLKHEFCFENSAQNTQNTIMGMLSQFF